MSTNRGEAGGRPEPLSVLEGRRPPLGGPYTEVPPHLEHHLREWARAFIKDKGGFEDRLAMNLEIVLPRRNAVPRTTDGPPALVDQPGIDLLDVVDLALRLDNELAEELRRQRDTEVHTWASRGRAARLRQLEQLLLDSNSAYRVDDLGEQVRLLRRLDPGVDAALDDAVATAEPTTSVLLGRARAAAYSRSPNPPEAYRNAVLAAERPACSTVIPDDGEGTLGKVIKCLRDAPQKWELRLADKGGPDAVDTFRGMLALLWRGEKRHASGDYRDVTLGEAQAAVVLAATCVQWLSDGVLSRRAAGSP